MSPRTRQHVNPFSFRQLAPTKPLSLPEIDVIEVDLGCGSGDYVIARAKTYPERFILGIDIRESFLAEGIEQIERDHIQNARLECRNLLFDGCQIFEGAKIAAFTIQFPDPLFKPSQRNRRWFTPASLNLLVDALVPEGSITFQSDVWEPSLDALSILEAHPQLHNVAGEFSFAKTRLLDQKTRREISCEERGLQIWRMRFIKRHTS